LGNYLNSTRGGCCGTTISGDINQDFHEETDTTGSSGVDAHLVIGNITIDESPDDKYIIISNRYDGWWGEAPGDSGIGTAMVLALARHLKDLQQNYSIDPKYNISFLFTTGEEFGFRGAQYYYDKLDQSGDLGKVKMWIGTDQLGQDQSDLVLAPEIRSPNGNASRNMDIVWAIANETNYVERAEYDFEPSIPTGIGGSEDAVWAEETDTIVFVKDNARAWDRWHASGRDYTEGDSLDYTDSNDVNITY